MKSAPSDCTAPDARVLATFRALVEAIVPNTPALAAYGSWQTYGAADLCIHEYMIWELDHNLSLMNGLYLTIIPLSAPTAGMLNAAAVQFIAMGQAQHAPDCPDREISPFSSLSPADRIRVLERLEELNVDLGALPPPYRNNGGMVRFMVNFLNRQTIFGHYSEWSAYGTTRLRTPVERSLEYFPIGWCQAGYPGVVPGYRALLGYKLTIVREGGKSAVV
ncbi:hypothetical protein KIH86_24425 [Paenibacillus sp. HN-1]|uniref:hypothetical protein n=1 Tax=Paenibacillus TaxID=44249 RepID=UPI001CA9C8B9|nr:MULTISPECIES: hypothetical protein [Paenibacillus]MBY9079171.1 hypothetical protein [Paenibacillus sp. CGMCC 1.18879]MBY9087334.1 hypothetical protein [Paenibacillus sinensis]